VSTTETIVRILLGVGVVGFALWYLSRIRYHEYKNKIFIELMECWGAHVLYEGPAFLVKDHANWIRGAYKIGKDPKDVASEIREFSNRRTEAIRAWTTDDTL
jgi:hypothetical protein